MAVLQEIKKSPEAIKAFTADRELSWFSQRVLKGREDVFCEVATITPSIAKHILDNNPANRRIKNHWVDGIAADILDNRWDVNGEAIVVAKDGSLNDGQHRLNAIIQANKSARTVIVFGVDRDSRFTVDLGNARTVGDFLGMEGSSHRADAASVAKLHFLYRNGYFTGGGAMNSSVLTKTVIRAEYWNYQKQIDRAIIDSDDKYLRNLGITAIACANVILHAINPGAASTFFQKFREGFDLPRGDAILALRLHMLEAKQDRLKASEKLEMVLRYWNAWRKGQSVSRRIGNRGQYPAIEG